MNYDPETNPDWGVADVPPAAPEAQALPDPTDAEVDAHLAASGWARCVLDLCAHARAAGHAVEARGATVALVGEDTDGERYALAQPANTADHTIAEAARTLEEAVQAELADVVCPVCAALAAWCSMFGGTP